MKLLGSSISGVCSKLPTDTELIETEFVQAKTNLLFFPHSAAKLLVIEASSRVRNILLLLILGRGGAKLSIIGLNIEC